MSLDRKYLVIKAVLGFVILISIGFFGAFLKPTRSFVAGIFSIVDVAHASTGSVYVSQTGGGSGSSCSSAESVAWLNSSAAWGSGTGQIGPGTTVNLCGTITTAIDVQASGTAGNPITIYFQPNAMMSSPVFPASGAISDDGYSYVTVDGGTNGIIQNTQNGTGLEYELESAGLYFSGSNNITIQNLAIDNIYKRTPESNDACEVDGNPDNLGCGHGIYMVSGSNILIQNNSIINAYSLISFGFTTGTVSNLTISGNTLENSWHNIDIGAGGVSDAYLNNVNIFGNTIGGFDVWACNPEGGTVDCSIAQYHRDGIMLQIQSPDESGAITNVNIYKNYFGPGNPTTGDYYAGTSAIFLDPGDTPVNSEFVNVNIYDNIFTLNPPYYWSDGYINSSGTDVLIANNTFVGAGLLNGGVGILFSSGQTLHTYNNILYQTATGTVTVDSIGDNTDNTGRKDSTIFSDYNDFDSTAATNPAGNGFGLFNYDTYISLTDLSQWQSTYGWDTHSITSDPMLVNTTTVYGTGNYHLQSGSLAIGAGINLTSYCTSGTNPATYLCQDYDGNPRPATGAWDIGAYQYTGSGTPTSYILSITAPTGGSISSNTGGISCGSTCSASYSSGSSVTLTETPNSGYTFSSWGGACSGTSSTCPLTISTNTSVSATFTQSVVSPVISSVTASNITSSGATITWTTSTAASSKVNYGPTSSYGGNTTLDSTLVTSHSQALSGLQASTLYHYQVLSTDGSGNATSSGDYTFTTESGGSTSYTLSVTAPTGGAITSNTGGISCGSTCSASYTSGTQVTLTESPSSGYTFSSWGGSCSGTSSTCNVTVSSNTSVSASFTQSGTSSTPPDISSISASNLTTSSATITWTTDAPSSSQIDYGLTSSYGNNTALDTNMVTSHSQSLSSLMPDTVYHYEVISGDSSGTTTSTDQTLTTTVVVVTTTPVILSGGGGGGGGGSSGGGGGSGGGSIPTAPVATSTPCTALPSAIPAAALTLTIGSRGTAVSSLQTFLVLQGDLNKQYVTGYYGPLTQAALASYEEAHPTSSCSKPATVSSSTVLLFTKTLSLGTNDPEVRELQVFLNNHGYVVSTTGNGSPSQETSYFGLKTKLALIRFQNAYTKDILTPFGLTQGTGYFGVSTMREVNALLTK